MFHGADSFLQEDALSAVNLILREGNQGQFPKGATVGGWFHWKMGEIIAKPMENHRKNGTSSENIGENHRKMGSSIGKWGYPIMVALFHRKSHENG